MTSSLERPEADTQSIDLARLYRALMARKRWIIIPTAAAFLLSLAYVETTAPRYTGVAKVLIVNQEGYFTQPDKAVIQQAPELDAEAIASEVEGVMTAQVAQKLVERLNLASNPEYNPELGFLSSLKARLFGPGAPGAPSPALIDNVLSHMTVFAQTKSRVIQIEFTSRSPELAASGANAIAQIFLENQQAAKQDEAKAASDWLAKKIEALRQKVAEAGAKTEAFRTQSGLFKSGAGPDTPTVSDQQLTDINTQLAAARAAAAQADAKASTLRSLISRGRIEEVPEAAKDESLRRFIEQRTTLRAQYASESKTLLPQHPKMRELSAQLSALDGEIKDAALRAVKGFENDSALAQEEVKNLSAAVDAQSKTVASGNEDDIELKTLELDQKAATDQLESYIQKFREASARDVADASPPNARIIATATPPRLPTFPQKLPIVILSTLAAALLSCGAAATQALLGEAPENAGERVTPLLADGTAPTASAAPVARAAPLSVFDPSHRLGPDISAVALKMANRGELAESLEAIAAERGPILIAVCGAESVTALAAALDLSRRLSEGQHTVLIDCGQTQDWLQDVIGAPCEAGKEAAGLAELSRAEANYAEVLRPDLSGELDILPLGQGALNTEALPDVFTALTRAYRCLVVSVSDWRTEEGHLALAAASLALLVGPNSAVEAAAASLKAAGAEAQGLVIVAQPEAPAKLEATAAA